MALKDRMKRLRREAQEGAVLLYQSDGTLKTFDTMTAWKEKYLAWVDLQVGRSLKPSKVFEAVRGATPESRAEFERRFGPIAMTTYVVENSLPGAWVKRRTLLEDGSVEEIFFEGDTEEAQRVLQEARQQ